MLTTEQNKLIEPLSVCQMTGKFRRYKEGRELMSQWPDSMKTTSEDIEESIFLIENDRSR